MKFKNPECHYYYNATEIELFVPFFQKYCKLFCKRKKYNKNVIMYYEKRYHIGLQLNHIFMHDAVYKPIQFNIGEM